jgi:prenyltransferase beta subunit
MRFPLLFIVLCPSVTLAQPPEALEAVARKLETLKFIASLETPQGGFAAAPQPPNIDAIPQPSLRATSGAVRAWKYLGGEQLGQKLPNKDRHAAFVLKCYDPNTGGFAESDSKPDVTITSIGVMAAIELGIPKEKFAKAMDYLKENAKTFEEVRIGAAAVEAWGVKDCPFDLKPWFKIAEDFAGMQAGDPQDGQARDTASLVAMWLRLGNTLPEGHNVLKLIKPGQRADGGWSKPSEKVSDIETTYRVMRALMLLKEKPKDLKKLREFVDSHRNADGGYATKPGEKSTMSGVYYAAAISKWLDDMEKK